MSARTKTAEKSPADKKWGFVAGCDGWVSKTQAAEMLGVSKRTIQNYYDRDLIRRGRTKAGRVCFCRHSVQLLMGVEED